MFFSFFQKSRTCDLGEDKFGTNPNLPQVLIFLISIFIFFIQVSIRFIHNGDVKYFRPSMG